MSDLLPFVPSDNNYRLVIPLAEAIYLFDVHWNARDAAWYFDLRAEDETAIALGIKIVLGVNLGMRCRNEFFLRHQFRVQDTSGERRDAGYDDLGARIQVVHTDLNNIGDLETA